MTKRFFALLLTLILLASFTISAPAEALPSPESAAGELYGRPWVTTYDSGNLPAERTSAADDLNIYVNFDLFDAHRDDFPMIQGLVGNLEEPRLKLTELIRDESFDYPGLDQLRIYYGQVADLETRDRQGIEPVRPYLDRIDAAQSIEELNAVLTAGDFPFLPFLTISLSCSDMRDVNLYTLYPHFTTGDNFNADRFVSGGSLTGLMMVIVDTLIVEGALMYLYPDSAIDDLPSRIYDFESAYGCFAPSSTLELNTPYGGIGALCSYLTCDELAERLPNFPAADMLKKEGCDPAIKIKIPCIEWMETLDRAWTEDNLDIIKLIAQVSIIIECKDCLASDMLAKGGKALMASIDMGETADLPDMDEAMVEDTPPIDPDACAYEACASVATFNQLLSAIYVDAVIGRETVDQLNALADDLIAAYDQIFDETAWMNDDSRAKAQEKLHAMRKCILEPDGGFYDFSGLELVPTEEGGTSFENYLRIKAYLRDIRNDIAGTPARAIFAWDAYGPLTVNCFYDGETNSINIMPGFINSSIMKNLETRESAMGEIGDVIAHEISHGFDSAGSQTNAYGVYDALFDAEDNADYFAEVEKLIDYYNAIEVMPGVMVDGNRVRVEAAADLCGMQVCLRAARNDADFDYERFFETYARNYADIFPAGFAADMAASDTHPLPHLRINVNAQMFDEFYQTYGAQEGDGMYLAPEARLKIFG